MPSEQSRGWQSGILVWNPWGISPGLLEQVASGLSQISMGRRVQDREGTLGRGRGVSQEGDAAEELGMEEGNGTGLGQLGS